MNIELDPKKIEEADWVEFKKKLDKAISAKKKILILATILFLALLIVLGAEYKKMVLDFAEIDQLEIRWDPYQESVEFDYYVTTPGKLEFEFGEMLYRTHYHKSGKEHFSWGVPAMRGGSAVDDARWLQDPYVQQTD